VANRHTNVHLLTTISRSHPKERCQPYTEVPKHFQGGIMKKFIGL